LRNTYRRNDFCLVNHENLTNRNKRKNAMKTAHAINFHLITTKTLIKANSNLLEM